MTTSLALLLSLALTASDAVGNPKDNLAPTCPAPASQDSAFLAALLATFENTPSEIRVLHVENLGLLDDPRAIEPLASLALDPDPKVAAAAIRTIGRFQTGRAEELLSNVVRHPKLSDTLKLLAIDQLVYQRSPSARAFLEATGNSRAPSIPIQNAAREAAKRWDPAPANRSTR